MQRAALVVVGSALLALLALDTSACAKSKTEETPAKPAADAGNARASAAAAALCTDGFHRRGDHWKVDCNACRCGADGAILCSQFPCAERVPADASSPVTGDH
jgi:hypothetical protein